jgi:hypothetical protein
MKPSPELFVPAIWAAKIMESFVMPGEPRMISNTKLKELSDSAMGMGGLEDVRDALLELQWRRLQQNKLNGKMKKLQEHIEEVRPQKASRLRRIMSRLKF